MPAAPPAGTGLASSSWGWLGRAGRSAAGVRAEGAEAAAGVGRGRSEPGRSGLRRRPTPRVGGQYPEWVGKRIGLPNGHAVRPVRQSPPVVNTRVAKANVADNRATGRGQAARRKKLGSGGLGTGGSPRRLLRHRPRRQDSSEAAYRRLYVEAMSPVPYCKRRPGVRAPNVRAQPKRPSSLFGTFARTSSVQSSTSPSSSKSAPSRGNTRSARRKSSTEAVAAPTGGG